MFVWQRCYLLLLQNLLGTTCNYQRLLLLLLLLLRTSLVPHLQNVCASIYSKWNCAISWMSMSAGCIMVFVVIIVVVILVVVAIVVLGACKVGVCGRVLFVPNRLKNCGNMLDKYTKHMHCCNLQQTQQHLFVCVCVSVVYRHAAACTSLWYTQHNRAYPNLVMTHAEIHTHTGTHTHLFVHMYVFKKLAKLNKCNCCAHKNTYS